MIKTRRDVEAAVQPRVPRDQTTVMANLDLARTDARGHAQSDEADRARVLVLLDRDQRLGVDAGHEHLGRVERLSGQHAQRARLAAKRDTDRLAAPRDRARQIGDAGRGEMVVERGQIIKRPDGDEVVAPEAPDLALYAALLVGALLARPRVLGLEQVVRAQRDEAVSLQAPAAP